MLINLTVRNIVLIDKLTLHFRSGLNVFTGETGAGKSVLLDALGLAAGDRADAGLIRQGETQASVSVTFHVAADHPAAILLAEQGFAGSSSEAQEIIVRRVLNKDGRAGAFVNDEPAGVNFLRKLSAVLIEKAGQNEQTGLFSPAMQLRLTDEFGDLALQKKAVREAFVAREAAKESYEAFLKEASEEDQVWLQHAVSELKKLNPGEGEEEELAKARKDLQESARYREVLQEALQELSGGDSRGRRPTSPGEVFRNAARILERSGRLSKDGGEDETLQNFEPVLKALSDAAEAYHESITILTSLLSVGEDKTSSLEEIEERLFALRALARKHRTTVADLPRLWGDLERRLQEVGNYEAMLESLAAKVREKEADYLQKAQSLQAGRREAKEKIEKAIEAELAPLRLEKAKFTVELTELPESAYGPSGIDRVRFLIATNPGTEGGPLNKIASGGELSRIMLALRLVLAKEGGIPVLIFDEVDSGAGGATADAIGQRLKELSCHTQVLAITHSAQIAAKAFEHFLVEKNVREKLTETTVRPLSSEERTEEIARMLSGSLITEEARSAARSLLKA